MDYHLSIHEADLQANLRVCGDFKGFSREYLEKRDDDFATSLQWDAMHNIMTLLTFRLILVPTEKDFMDYTTINIFLAVIIGDEDPIPTLLADVYHTLYQRDTKRGGMLMCYAHLLYKWLISHVYKDITAIEGMNGHKWVQYLVSLTQKDILWFPQILNRKDMIRRIISQENSTL